MEAGHPWSRKERRKDSIRFTLRDREESGTWTRDKFKTFVLKEVLEVKLSDILCLQDYCDRGVFELTLVSSELCFELWRKILERKGKAPLSLFRVNPMFAGSLRKMTVFVFDPFVSEEDIDGFLNEFVLLQGKGERELDSEGVWTGKRIYWMRLRFGGTEEGGVLHPPAFFEIGTERGYLVYPGQPLACRKCGVLGHYAAKCTTVFCSRCKEQGHVLRDCRKEVRCFSCGESGHIYRNCVGRTKVRAEQDKLEGKERVTDGNAVLNSAQEEDVDRVGKNEMGTAGVGVEGKEEEVQLREGLGADGPVGGSVIKTSDKEGVDESVVRGNCELVVEVREVTQVTRQEVGDVVRMAIGECAGGMRGKEKEGMKKDKEGVGDESVRSQEVSVVREVGKEGMGGSMERVTGEHVEVLTDEVQAEMSKVEVVESMTVGESAGCPREKVGKQMGINEDGAVSSGSEVREVGTGNKRAERRVVETRVEEVGGAVTNVCVTGGSSNAQDDRTYAWDLTDSDVEREHAAYAKQCRIEWEKAGHIEVPLPGIPWDFVSAVKVPEVELTEENFPPLGPAGAAGGRKSGKKRPVIVEGTGKGGSKGGRVSKSGCTEGHQPWKENKICEEWTTVEVSQEWQKRIKVKPKTCLATVQEVERKFPGCSIELVKEGDTPGGFRIDGETREERTQISKTLYDALCKSLKM
ncbi:ZCHC3 protein, partial [Atractosteus spatula]|nr:ZCHC3 protein [Atractosteus spatula]